MLPTERLSQLGQSLWLDNITREMLDTGSSNLHRGLFGDRVDIQPGYLRHGHTGLRVI